MGVTIMKLLSVVMHWSVISIGHYQPLFLVAVLVISERCNWYCKKCTNNVISYDHSIINWFYDTQNYRENYLKM